MAILTVCVNKQRKRKDGCYSVYIRVAHNGKSVYMPTDKVVGTKGLSSSMEVIDPFVLKPLSSQIVSWLDALNRQDISVWTANSRDIKAIQLKIWAQVEITPIFDKYFFWVLNYSV